MSLKSDFRAIIAQQTEKWDGLWKQGVAPHSRWDIGQCEPDLVYEATHGILQPASKSAVAFTPGCGRGYAVRALAEAGYASSLGLELSPTAVEVAQQSCPHERAQYRVGDFFAMDAGESRFDVIFDSTFLCAIPPTLRRAWASQMSSLLKEGGLLAIQVFPVAKDASQVSEIDVDGPFEETGPPYRLTLKHIEALFQPHPGMKLVLVRETPIERQARAFNAEKWGEGLTEYFMVWQNQRPHL